MHVDVGDLCLADLALVVLPLAVLAPVVAQHPRQRVEDLAAVRTSVKSIKNTNVSPTSKETASGNTN